VAALLGLAAAATHLGDLDRARRAAQAAFDETDAPGLRAEAQLLLLRSGGQEPAEADGSLVVAAMALSMMDRWAEAAERLNSPEPHRAAGRPAAWVPLRERTSAVVGPWHPVSTDAPVIPADSLHRDRSEHPLHRDRLVQRVGIRLVVGDVSDAEQFMRRSGWTEADLPWPERALLAWRHGDWSAALDHAARADLAASPVPPLDAVLNRARATITLARGYPLRAREFLASSAGGSLPHLRSLTESEISMYIGDTEAAVAGLHRAAAEAARAGVSIGTDEIWLRLTELAWSQQDMARAREYAARAVRAAQTVGTVVSHLYAGLARLVADPEPGPAAQEALDLARELGQPWLLATTLERVATWRAGPPELLAQAYEQFGELDALLDRARLRTTMRVYGVTVPNRAATAAENERLLAQLVADGLSGPELAATLRTTGKSIESRLGRLFARTGYRSRAALAAAVANGDRRGVS
jgi:DNA-binding CsgD family transcriptional regulator